MKGDKKIMPEILVLGWDMGSLDALAAMLARMFKDKTMALDKSSGEQPVKEQ